MPRELTIAKDAVVASEDGEMFTVTIPDSAGIVTEDELRDGYVTKAKHTRLEGEVQTRITSAVETAKGAFRTEAIEDDVFLGEAIKGRKEFFAGKFPKAGEGPTPDELFEKWKPEHLAPLETRITELEGSNRSLQSSAVSGDRARAIQAAGVDKDHVTLMEDHLTLRTEWSPEHERTVVIDPSKPVGDEKRIQTTLKGADLVPTSPEEYLVALRQSGKMDHAFSAEIRSGADTDLGGGGGGKETTQEAITRLEGEKKFGEAPTLKEKLIQDAKGGAQ